MDALARFRPGSTAALADLRDVPRFSRNKRKQYGDAIVAALQQACQAESAVVGITVNDTGLSLLKLPRWPTSARRRASARIGHAALRHHGSAAAGPGS